jgi:hypothetical protein
MHGEPSLRAINILQPDEMGLRATKFGFAQRRLDNADELGFNLKKYGQLLGVQIR